MSTGIQPHDEKPAGVWNSGGARYDRISRGIADGIEHRVLRLDPRPGERVLDLAAGTGWTSRLVARRGAQVIGADISADLLAFAAERAKAEGLDVEYRVADAEDLPFADGEFDAVISTCGVMFTSRPEAAAAELGRVCRKGGRIALTTWLSDGNLSKMFMVMRPYMPPPPDPAPPSPFGWGRTERIAELLGEDFDLAFEKGVSFYREPGSEAAWETFSQGYGPTKSLAASLDEGRRAELRRDFIASTTSSPRRSAYAYRANTGSRAASAADERFRTRGLRGRKPVAAPASRRCPSRSGAAVCFRRRLLPRSSPFAGVTRFDGRRLRR